MAFDWLNKFHHDMEKEPRGNSPRTRFTIPMKLPACRSLTVRRDAAAAASTDRL